VLNWIWLFMILCSVAYAGFHGRMAEVQQELFESARAAVQLVIGLVGVMVFMLGIMRVAFDGGLREAVARGLAPLMRRLFPEVPPDHPAMSAIVMNMASNMLGLGNAATPFGLKAMVELGKLNPHPGSASNAMVLFLAINTSAICVLPPGGTVGVRLAAGSQAPMAIWIPTLIATTCSTAAAVAVYYLLRRLPMYRHRDLPPSPTDVEGEPPAPDLPEVGVATGGDRPREPMGWLRGALIGGVILLLAVALFRDGARQFGTLPPADAFAQLAQDWAFLLLVTGMLLIGVARRVPVYESMVAGAREGLDVAVRIVPYLVAMLAAVAMLKASGAMDEIVIPLLRPFTDAIGVPAEVMPMALLRPLSGSGAFAVMSDTLTRFGPDSFIGMLTSTLQGSTETTFYVLALYLGAARIRDGRHTLAACLSGDVAGFFGSVLACRWFFG